MPRLVGLAILPVVAQYQRLGPLAAALVALQALIFMILLWEPAYRRAVALVRRTRLLRRFERGLQNLRPASLRLTARTVAGIVVPGAIALALTFLLFELVLDAVGVESIGFDRAASIYAVAYLVSALTTTPVGMGAYDGILTGFMALQGVSPSAGAAAAILYRGFNEVFMAGFGLFFLMRLPVQQRRHATASFRDEFDADQRPA